MTAKPTYEELEQRVKELEDETVERKRAEEALRESDNQYRELVQNANSAIIRYQADGTITFFNEYAQRFFGYRPEEIIGKHVGILVPEQESSGADLTGLVQDIIEHPHRYTNNINENVCRDGRRVWMNWTNRAILAPNGRVAEILTVGSDITEKKLAEESLSEDRAKLEAALESMSDAVFISDVKGHFINFNEAFATFHRLGNKSECLKALADWPSILNVYLPDGTLLPLDKWVVNRALRGETETNTEYTLRRKDTGETWIGSYSFAPIRNKDGVIVGSVVVARDITEQKQAQEELKKQKILFETMFNTIPDGVVIANTKREIQLANKGMEPTFGYKPEELLGKSTKILYCDERKYTETGAAMFNRNAEKPDQLYVTRYRDKNAREFSGETFGAKLFDENHKWIGNLGIMRDITEREQAELRIRQAQKMESIGNLAGGIAHDFNNILFPIIGMSELLMEDLEPGSTEYENAQEILKAGKRGSDLVRQILAFSRQSEHKLIPVRAQQILREVLKLMRATIPAYIEIDEDIQWDCGLLMADPTQIHQVAMNIITNAFHAVESKGGKISVQLKEIALAVDELTDSSLAAGRYVRFSITDTGHGMSQDLMNKIFEPYFTTKEQGKGTGLGLAVTFGIIREHKGDIKVYSEVGKGTTFNVYLPLMKKTVDVDTIQQAKSDPRGNEHILLVDDDESIVNLEKQMLVRLGYHVTELTSSLEALKSFKANPSAFDLVVSDMTMPNMTGDQLARKLKSIRREIPVIICTGFSERINEENAHTLGIKGLLMKPVIRSEMAKMVRKVLDESKLKSKKP